MTKFTCPANAPDVLLGSILVIGQINDRSKQFSRLANQARRSH